MKFDLRNYEVLLPPYPLDYDNWDEAQAHDYLNWFISKIPERVDYVCWRYHKDNIFSKKLDPNDPESLLRIWRWFLPRAKIEQMPKEVAEAHLAAFSYLGGSWQDTRQLSSCTECVTRDIGMLMGHMFTANYPQQLYWTAEKGVKYYVSRWRPVLNGFINVDFGKPAHMALDVLAVVYTQAAGLLIGKASTNDLMRAYRVWEKDIPAISDCDE